MSGYQDGPVRALILSRLEEAFGKAYDEKSVVLLKNESHLHNVPDRSEKHFAVTIATNLFASANFKNRLARHRFVYAAVGDDLLLPTSEHPQAVVHMLTINAWTMEEFYERGGVAEPSPPCLGGVM